MKDHSHLKGKPKTEEEEELKKKDKGSEKSSKELLDDMLKISKNIENVSYLLP